MENTKGSLFTNGMLVCRKKDGNVQLITSVEFAESRGWIYGISYTKVYEDYISIEGGGSFWHNEDDFEPILLPKTKLLAEKYYRTVERNKITNRLKQLSNELTSIDFAIELIQKGSTSCAQEIGPEQQPTSASQNAQSGASAVR